jgi:FkbM family methyltransferase
MPLLTKHKIYLARAAYRAVALTRGVAGLGTTIQARRSGILWSLDLAEGIDFAIYLLGAFERSTARTLQSAVSPNATVLDIGANIGAHTLPLARFVGPQGRVYAFEPTDWAFAKLRANLDLNPDLASRVEAYQAFLTNNKEGALQAEIYSSWPLEDKAGLHPKHLGQRMLTTGATVYTLDDFVAAHKIACVDLIKIDVDGHEYQALSGGRSMLERDHPTLVMELSPYVHDETNGNFPGLIELLRDCGYSARDIANGKPVPLETAKLRKLIPDGASINIIALKQ